MMLDYQCATRMAVASSRLPEFVPFRCPALENGVRKRHFLHRFEKFERGKIRPFFTPFCSLLGYGMITYTSNNPLIRVILNQ